MIPLEAVREKPEMDLGEQDKYEEMEESRNSRACQHYVQIEPLPNKQGPVWNEKVETPVLIIKHFKVW